MTTAERAPVASGFLPAPVRPEHRIWWELHGTGEREVVCLLNGLAMHTKAWHPFLDDLAGEQDRCIPLAAQSRLAEVFPRSRFELVPESGHVVYLERRDLFFPRLRRYFASRDPHA